MQIRQLTISGCYELIPELHHDHRGVFFEWFTQSSLAHVVNQSFKLEQANCSVSSAGVLRGLHFSQSPPGQSKYITCCTGAILDVVVDIRLGSPTFGQWDSILLDSTQHHCVLLAPDVAHGFFALQDHSTVMYLCSSAYTPSREHTIYALDPVLKICWPTNPSPLLSSRDATAPCLTEMLDSGLLPIYQSQ